MAASIVAAGVGCRNTEPESPMMSESERISRQARREEEQIAQVQFQKALVSDQDCEVTTFHNGRAITGRLRRQPSWKKPGDCTRSIPALPVSLAYVAIGLNIVVPGSGTATAGGAILCGSPQRIPTPARELGRRKCGWLVMGTALAQFILAPIVIGWIWSILYGIELLKKAKSHDAKMRSLAALNAKRSEDSAAFGSASGTGVDDVEGGKIEVDGDVEVGETRSMSDAILP